MTKIPHTIVFVASHPDRLKTTILPLCHRLQSVSQFALLVVLESDIDNRMRDLCISANVSWHSDAPRTSVVAAKPVTSATQHRHRSGSWSNFWRGVSRVARLPKLVLSASGPIHQRAQQLKQWNSAVIVLLDDNTISTCRWCGAARAVGIPTLVVQGAAQHRADTVCRIRQTIQEQHGEVALPGDSLIARLIPQAARRCNGKNIWYVSPDQALSLWLAGAFPKYNPWTVGGGNADVVAVFGAIWKKRFVADGAPADKIRVTGHPAQDIWFELASRWTAADRAAVLAELEVPPEREIITLISPSISFREAGGARNDIPLSHLQNELLSVVNSISRFGRNFVPVVKGHPRDTIAHLDFLRHNSTTPLKIVTDYDVHRLIAGSSAMACQWSTTAMLAQALGTPVLLFDFHGCPSADMWRDADLDQATSPAQFDALLKRSLCDSQTRAVLHERRKRFVAEYLCLDGNATERIVGLIHELANQKSGVAWSRAA